MTTPQPQGWEERFEEKGADLEHERWAGWQKYIHSLCIKNPDGTLTIPKERVERWERQINTAYKDLPENEKESDRNEVRKYLPLITTLLAEQKQALVREIVETVKGQVVDVSRLIYLYEHRDFKGLKEFVERNISTTLTAIAEKHNVQL